MHPKVTISAAFTGAVSDRLSDLTQYKPGQGSGCSRWHISCSGGSSTWAPMLTGETAPSITAETVANDSIVGEISAVHDWFVTAGAGAQISITGYSEA